MSHFIVFVNENDICIRVLKFIEFISRNAPFVEIFINLVLLQIMLDISKLLGYLRTFFELDTKKFVVIFALCCPYFVNEIR
jgi:hypothetical protein